MKSWLKGLQSRNLIASYFIGCVLAIIYVICMSINSNDFNGFMFGFYLFLFCQILIWEPISIITILFIQKTGILSLILESFWQCVIYAILPSFLMFTDAYFGNVWIKLFNVDSIFLLILVYLSYYIATIFIAVMHRLIVYTINKSR